MMKRQQATINDQSGPTIIVEGNRFDYFAGGDYLDLKDDPMIRSFLQENITKHAFTKGPSYLGLYPDVIEKDFRKAITKFFQCEEFIDYPSGSFGNGVLTRYLSPRIDKIFIDEYSHYSIFDGAKLSGKPIFSFPHRDIESLERIMTANLKPDEVPLIMTDGVFVVTGNIPPVHEYVSLLEEKNHGALIIDDAHAIGTMGPNGRGTLDYFKVSYDQVYSHASITKAIGSHGGILPGSHKMFQEIKGREENIHLGPTGMSNVFKLITIKAFEIIRENPQRVRNLQKNSMTLRKHLNELGISVDITPSPIIGLTKFNAKDINLAKLAEFLHENHIIVHYRDSDRYSGIPEGGGLKIVANTNHTNDQIKKLISLIQRFRD